MRVICPNCGRAFQALGADAPECPRCHFRAASAASFAPAAGYGASAGLAPSSFSLPTPEPLPGVVSAPAAAAPGTNGLSVAALVLGVLSIVLWPLAVLALILGIAGKVQTNKSRQAGGGLAVAGIVLGALVIGVWVMIFAILYAAFG